MRDSRSAAECKPCVYFIRAGSVGAIKIGTTKGTPHARLRDLQTGNPEPLSLLAAMPGGTDVERALHERFADSRLTGEWFKPTERLLGFVEGVAAACEVPEDDGAPSLSDGVTLQDVVFAVEMVPGWNHALDVAEQLENGAQDTSEWSHDLALAYAAVSIGDARAPGSDGDEARAKRALAVRVYGVDKIVGAANRIIPAYRAMLDNVAQSRAEAKLAEAQQDGIDPSTYGVSAEVAPYPFDVVDDAPESGPRVAVQ